MAPRSSVIFFSLWVSFSPEKVSPGLSANALRNCSSRPSVLPPNLRSRTL